MQLNWLSRDSVGKTVFYFFFQWQLENRIITIAPVVSFIWSLKTVIYHLCDWETETLFWPKNFWLLQKKIVIHDTSDLQSATLFFHLYMLLTLSHVPCMCCMSHGGCVVITLHVSYFAALFLWISHLSCSLSSSCFRQCHISHLNTLESCALSFSDTII